MEQIDDLKKGETHENKRDKRDNAACRLRGRIGINFSDSKNDQTP
jgi:hypothetical protein